METMKVYPTCDELNTINSCLPCTEDGCTSIFTSQSNLNLHLLKTHKKHFKFDSKIKEFYCPKTNCAYNSIKCFKTLKLLKQHFLKVHADKEFICEICSTGFATLKFKSRHKEYCGVNFTCCDCKLSYSCYETLLTHARRKSHKILEKSCYSCNWNQTGCKIYKCISGSDINIAQNETFILPKACTSFQLINMVPFVGTVCAKPTDKGSQTETHQLPNLKSKYTQVDKELNYIDSKQSQTLLLKKNFLPVGTQTIIKPSTIKKPKLIISDVSLNDVNALPNNAINFKDTNTQTQLISSRTKSCNTSFELLGSEPIIERSSSSTQTNILKNEILYSTSTATHDSIYTDTSDLNFELNHSSSQTCFNDMSIFDSSTFFNCNIETQTDFMLESDFLTYEDSSILTQNCEDSLTLKNDILELESDLLSSTIYTQTVFEDVARSVESQTTMSLNKMPIYLTCRDMANMETQTETNFKNLLEEVDA